MSFSGILFGDKERSITVILRKWEEQVGRLIFWKEATLS